MTLPRDVSSGETNNSLRDLNMISFALNVYLLGVDIKKFLPQDFPCGIFENGLF